VEDVGWSELEIRPALSRTFGSQLERDATHASSRAGSSAGTSLGRTMGTRASTAMRHQFSEAARYIAAPLLGAFAVEKIGELVGDSIRGAVEDAASENRVKLIFGPASEEINKFSANAAKKYGLADDAARSAASGFGLLFRQAKETREEGAKDSIQMVKLAADLAAFAHTDPEQAFTALQRGLAGSTRGLKPFGILIDGAQQKAEALQLGLLKPVKDSAKIHSAQVAVLKDQAAYNDAVTKSGKGSLAAQEAQAKLGAAQETLRKSVEGTVPPLTAQQKVIANQALILDQTKTQQGQFARSSDKLAQQQRILSASWENAKDTLGRGLMPVATDFVHLINKDVIPAVDDAATWFEHDGARSIHHFTDELKPLASSALPALKTGLHDVVGEAKYLAPKVKSIFDAFNRLPGWAQKAVVLGAGATYLGHKSGLLGVGTKALLGGGSGGIAGALGATRGTPANPLYVIDISGGLGGAGTGGKGVPLWAAGKGATAAGTAAAEANAAREATAAAEAVRAAGGGAAAASSAAGRAFKEAMAAHDAAVLKEALNFGIKGGGRGLAGGLLRTVLAPPAALTLAGQGAEQKQLTPMSLTAAQFAQQFKGATSLPNLPGAPTSAILKAYGLTASEARDILGIGLKATSTRLDALRGNLEKTSRDIDLVTRAGAGQSKTFLDLAGKSDKYARALDSLPDQVQTQVLTPGLLTSQTDVEHLQRQYQLTPKEVTTLYKLLGLDKARRDFDALQAHMGRHTTLGQQLDLAGNRSGMTVNGDVHLHSPDPTGKLVREQRQRANTDGTRRGGIR